MEGTREEVRGLRVTCTLPPILDEADWNERDCGVVRLTDSGQRVHQIVHQKERILGVWAQHLTVTKTGVINRPTGPPRREK